MYSYYRWVYDITLALDLLLTMLFYAEVPSQPTIKLRDHRARLVGLLPSIPPVWHTWIAFVFLVFIWLVYFWYYGPWQTAVFQGFSRELSLYIFSHAAAVEITLTPSFSRSSYRPLASCYLIPDYFTTCFLQFLIMPTIRPQCSSHNPCLMLSLLPSYLMILLCTTYFL